MKRKYGNDLIITQKTTYPQFVVNDSGECSADSEVSSDIKQNETMLRSVFAGNATFILRNFVSGNGNTPCLAAYFDGLVNGKTIYESVIAPIMTTDLQIDCIQTLSEQILQNGETKIVSCVSNCFDALFDGDTVLFVDGCNGALIVNTKGFPVRSVTEPEIEKSLSGPREGFTESVMMNTAMLHRKLKTIDFHAEPMNFGTRTKTKAFLCYLESVAKPELIREVRRRLKKIRMDGVLDANYIAEQIADSPMSLLKTVGYTEKPDVAAGMILEGRVALILDGTPVVLILPTLFVECFHDAEDYYTGFYYASVGRILRMICFIFTIYTPAIFIALVSFHPEMLPTDLALSIAQARDGVPFPVTLECFLMIAVFDILREASQRLPNSIAQTLGIVGAIVVGEAAVSARFIGATTLIVVAFSGICGLMLPKLKAPVIYYRLFLLTLASFFGFYGILFGGLVILIRMMDLKSFGVPYLSYLFSPRLQDQKDVIIRAPWWIMRTRPTKIAADKIRQKRQNNVGAGGKK